MTILNPGIATGAALGGFALEHGQTPLILAALLVPRGWQLLHHAYLLKEGLRVVFQLPYDEAVEALGPVGQLGPPLPDTRVREAAKKDRQAPRPGSCPRSSRPTPGSA